MDVSSHAPLQSQHEHAIFSSKLAKCSNVKCFAATINIQKSSIKHLE